MELRMRKSIKICKGVRVNFGKKGASLSFGTRGLRYTIHSSGRRTSSVGIPGTGISCVTSSGGSKRQYSSSAYNRKQRIQLEKQQQKMNEMQHIYSLNEPFNPERIEPREAEARKALENYKPSFLENMIKPLGEKKRLQLKEAIEAAVREDAEDYESWKNLYKLAGRILK